jgi:hypothetical protein
MSQPKVFTCTLPEEVVEEAAGRAGVQVVRFLEVQAVLGAHEARQEVLEMEQRLVFSVVAEEPLKHLAVPPWVVQDELLLAAWNNQAAETEPSNGLEAASNGLVVASIG